MLTHYQAQLPAQGPIYATTRIQFFMLTQSKHFEEKFTSMILLSFYLLLISQFWLTDIHCPSIETFPFNFIFFLIITDFIVPFHQTTQHSSPDDLT